MTIQKIFDKEEQYQKILPKIKCKICGREFEKITLSHLRKHNITMYEYKEQFPYALIVSEGYRKRQREGHLGKHLTQKHKENIGKAHLGKHHTEGSKQLIGKIHMGKYLTEETKQKISDANSGENNPMFGRTGKNHPMFGKKRPEQSKRLRGKNNHMYGRIGKDAPTYGMSGEKSPRWQGGISFEPYCIKFDDDLKERVREFFNRCCYVCGKNEIDNGQKLSVHHVNYGKMVCCNDVKPLFVPLCHSCHGKTQKDREYWEEFFTVSLEYLTNGECFLPKPDSIKILPKT